MTRTSATVFWGWLLFEIASGFIFDDESFLFKTGYFILTSLPMWGYFAFLSISQLMDRVGELERKVDEIQLNK